MTIRGRVYYNQIKIQMEEEGNPQKASWEVEDLRTLSLSLLFSRLTELGLSLSEADFAVLAESHESPEGMALALFHEEGEEKRESGYLLLFELWRRLCRERPSLSIFCDELDHLITQYDQGLLVDEESLQMALNELENLLDAHVDQGMEPNRVFNAIRENVAHDLEHFIQDYIVDQIEVENLPYASELVDGFYDYVNQPHWMDLFKVRLLYQLNADEGMLLLHHLLDYLEQYPEFDLLLEVLKFLTHTGETALFLKIASIAIKIGRSEEEFQELVLATSHFFRNLDQGELEQRLSKLLERRRERTLDHPVDPKDADFQEFSLFLQHLQFTKPGEV